jgi:hypothetical protein
VAEEITIGGDGALFVGEDKTIRLELLDVNGMPVPMTGWTILFDVRKNDTSAEPAILSKTPSLTGAYDSVRATNTQRAIVTLTDTELNLFKAQTYRYSFKRMDNDSEMVLAWGDFAPQKATAP